MFYVIEIQQYADLSYGHIVHWAETRNQADAKYYTVLAWLRAKKNHTGNTHKPAQKPAEGDAEKK